MKDGETLYEYEVDPDYDNIVDTAFIILEAEERVIVSTVSIKRHGEEKEKEPKNLKVWSVLKRINELRWPKITFRNWRKYYEGLFWSVNKTVHGWDWVFPRNAKFGDKSLGTITMIGHYHAWITRSSQTLSDMPFWNAKQHQQDNSWWQLK